MHGNVLCFVQHVDYGGAKEGGARERGRRSAAAAFAECECGSTRSRRTWAGGCRAAVLLSILLRGRREREKEGERKMSTLNAAKIEYRAAR